MLQLQRRGRVGGCPASRRHAAWHTWPAEATQLEIKQHGEFIQEPCLLKEGGIYVRREAGVALERPQVVLRK